jgi:hypothetical protein
MSVDEKFNQSEFEGLNSRGGGCSSIARLTLEMREKNPEKFLHRAPTPVSRRENISEVRDPFEKPFTPTPLKEETDSFLTWKSMVYDFGKRLYGVEDGDIDEGMLQRQWSEGSTPEAMVRELGRKLGMEMIADPESVFK